jgi:hypothetical protein
MSCLAVHLGFWCFRHVLDGNLRISLVEEQTPAEVRPTSPSPAACLAATFSPGSAVPLDSARSCLWTAPDCIAPTPAIEETYTENKAVHTSLC